MSKNKIQHQVKGKGKPIFSLHGWGGSINSLKSLQDELAKNYQVVNVELSGFGQSPEPNSVYGIEDFVKEIISLADSLKIKQFALFGHSFGGQIAAKMALDYPNRVSHLILCGAAVIRKRSTITKLIIRAGKIFKKVGLGQIASLAFTRSDYHKASPKMKQIMNKVLNQDLTEELKDIKIPTLILWGDHDNYTPVTQAYFIKSQIKNIKLKIFPGQRHNLPLVSPKQVAEEICKFY